MIKKCLQTHHKETARKGKLPLMWPRYCTLYLLQWQPPEEASYPSHGCAILHHLLKCFLSWTQIAHLGPDLHSCSKTQAIARKGKVRTRCLNSAYGRTRQATARKGKFSVTWQCTFEEQVSMDSKVSTNAQARNHQKELLTRKKCLRTKNTEKPPERASYP